MKEHNHHEYIKQNKKSVDNTMTSAMLCPRCKWNQTMHNENICYECYELEHYNKYCSHVNDIPDDILKRQNKCPIVYSDVNDIRKWHIENGMAITTYRTEKDTK